MTAAIRVDRRATRVRPMLSRALLLLAVPAVLTVIWAIVAALIESTVIVGPVESLGQIVDTLSSRRYQASLAASIQTIAVGFALAVILGGAVGFALGLTPFWFRAIGPILQGVYSIPKVALFPLFLVFLGLGLTSRTAFAFIHGFFPMAIIVMGATANLRMNAIYLKLGASLDMSFGRLVRTILLPAILPSFLTATRITFGLVFLGAILAEMFASNGGLGHELVRNMHLVRVDRILAQVVIIGILAVIPNALLAALEARLTRRLHPPQASRRRAASRAGGSPT